MLLPLMVKSGVGLVVLHFCTD